MNEKIILYYVKKDLCKMIIETEQKIQVWENKKEEVLKKHPDHRFSELRSLKQNCFTYKLLIDELDGANTLQDVTNNFYKIFKGEEETKSYFAVNPLIYNSMSDFNGFKKTLKEMWVE